MLAAMKAAFVNPPDRYVMFNAFKPVVLKEDAPEAVFEGLPRLINPNGVDDTAKICASILETFPAYADFPNQDHNRRSLYMSIYRLRQTEIGWSADHKAEKITPKLRILN
jgi:hypothetical protein